MATRLITTPDGRRIPDPRSTQAWRKLAKRVAIEEPTCWLRFEGCTIRSTTGDHVIPVTVRPDLALVRSNVRGACPGCNYKRGNLPVDSLRLGGQMSRPSALDIFD
ncbi:HNH endonuclease [Nocardioides jensenii]|uniref:HNH endonuclease n=1 Tax=Nocardioides jensenii TaxID=1843 RepID=UPI0008320ED4|nr:HNH endonuclease [Nocardioides jensenii]